jgi:hypothetical protein
MTGCSFSLFSLLILCCFMLSETILMAELCIALNKAYVMSILRCVDNSGKVIYVRLLLEGEERPSCTARWSQVQVVQVS